MLKDRLVKHTWVFFWAYVKYDKMYVYVCGIGLFSELTYLHF